jgi:Zn-dependent peptidase ImmA (M78 family)/transcriptional regulator with XRE-family HTH domain
MIIGEWGSTMKPKPLSGIAPSVLRWARESAGMSIDDVAVRLKKKPEIVSSWEDGSLAPTYPQLESLAYDHYKRPLAVFFLPAPPEEVRPKQEFRTLPSTDIASLTRDTVLHIRKAHAYQLSLQEFYAGINPAEAKLWDRVQLAPDDDVVEKARQIRTHLGVTIEVQRKWARDEDALRDWRRRIESAGIFVFKDSFKQRQISGFCLEHEQFPLAYINNSTTKTRQIFSLLHEVAHLLFHENGISKFDRSYIDDLPKKEKSIEVFCNAVAAEILIPSEEFAEVTRAFPDQVTGLSDEAFASVAKYFAVSREAVLRRFVDLGRSTSAFYENKAAQWTAQLSKKVQQKGNWAASKKAYLSDRLLNDVVARRARNQISTEEAAGFLGIKPRSFQGLEEAFFKGNSV